MTPGLIGGGIIMAGFILVLIWDIHRRMKK
jgi:hypothetical protein